MNQSLNGDSVGGIVTLSAYKEHTPYLSSCSLSLYESMFSLVSWGNDLNYYMMNKRVIDIIMVIRI